MVNMDYNKSGLERLRKSVNTVKELNKLICLMKNGCIKKIKSTDEIKEVMRNNKEFEL